MRAGAFEGMGIGPGEVDARRVAANLAGAIVVGSVVAVDPGGWYPFGPTKWLVISTLVCACAAYAWWNGLRPALSRRFVVVGCLFLTWLGVTAVVGRDPLYAWIGTPERRLGVITWVLFAACCAVGASIGGAWAPRLMRWGALAGLACVAYATVEWWFGAPVDVATTSRRLGGPYGSAAYLGAALCLLVPISVGVATRREEDRWWRAVGAAAAVGGVVVAVGSGSRAALVGLAVGAVVVIIRLRPARRHLRVGYGAVVLAVVVMSPRLGDVLDRSASATSRLDEWSMAARVVADHPIVGAGPEGYRTVVADGVTADYERTYGRDVLPDRAHNAVLDVAAIAGLPGALLYLALMVMVVRAAWAAARRDDVEAWLAVGVIAYLAQQLLLFPLAEIDPIVWLAAGVVLASHSSRKAKVGGVGEVGVGVAGVGSVGPVRSVGEVGSVGESKRVGGKSKRRAGSADSDEPVWSASALGSAEESLDGSERGCGTAVEESEGDGGGGSGDRTVVAGSAGASGSPRSYGSVGPVGKSSLDGAAGVGVGVVGVGSVGPAEELKRVGGQPGRRAGLANSAGRVRSVGAPGSAEEWSGGSDPVRATAVEESKADGGGGSEDQAVVAGELSVGAVGQSGGGVGRAGSIGPVTASARVSWRSRVAGVTAGAIAVVMFVTGVVGVAADRAARRAATQRGDAALASAERAAELRPDVLRYHLLVASEATALGTLAGVDAAIAATERAVEVSPHDPIASRAAAQARLDSARVTGDSDDLATALDAWQELATDDPLCRACQYGLGIAAALGGDVSIARQAWTAASVLSRPGDTRAADALAALDEVQG